MPETEGRPLERHDIVDAGAELSETDLECVVGGLARPWTETDIDEWLIDTAPLL
jgi:hypothetical protein